MNTLSKQDVRDARLIDEDQPVLSSIEDIIADVKAGKPVIIVDDEDRENEGDLIIAAEMASAEAINFMAKEGRGLICLPMEAAMIDRLGLDLMGRGDNARHRTAFTVSIEAKEGVTTGISAMDRAQTIKVAIDPQSTADDIATPGHVFPLRAREGGVLVRAGHTEAAVDLAKLAGFSGAGVICEIMNDDGSMARLPQLVAYGQKHGLKIGTIADLIAYRAGQEMLVREIAACEHTTEQGYRFMMHRYESVINGEEVTALVKGDLAGKQTPLVRMHSFDFERDVLRVDRTLPESMRLISQAECGVVVILQHAQTPKASEDEPGEPVHPLRRIGIGAQVLKTLGVSEMILLTDSPKPVIGLEGYGLEIKSYQPIKDSQ